jgi:hypothetical protein
MHRARVSTIVKRSAEYNEPRRKEANSKPGAPAGAAAGAGPAPRREALDPRQTGRNRLNGGRCAVGAPWPTGL